MDEAAEIDLVDARDHVPEPDLVELRTFRPIAEPVLASDVPEVADFFFTKRVALVRMGVVFVVAFGVLVMGVATAIADDAYESIGPEPTPAR